MRVAVPKEIKNNEYRVAITPAGVHELVTHGHEVFVEKDAGVGSSITDDEFTAAGATIIGAAKLAGKTAGVFSLGLLPRTTSGQSASWC